MSYTNHIVPVSVSVLPGLEGKEGLVESHLQFADDTPAMCNGLGRLRMRHHLSLILLVTKELWWLIIRYPRRCKGLESSAKKAFK